MSRASIKNTQEFKFDCSVYEQFIAECKDENLSKEFSRKYKRFLELIDDLDKSVFELSSSKLSYHFLSERKNELILYKRYLDEKTKRLREKRLFQ